MKSSAIFQTRLCASISVLQAKNVGDPDIDPMPNGGMYFNLLPDIAKNRIEIYSPSREKPDPISELTDA